jgi:hypothetical protein
LSIDETEEERGRGERYGIRYDLYLAVNAGGNKRNAPAKTARGEEDEHEAEIRG